MNQSSGPRGVLLHGCWWLGEQDSVLSTDAQSLTELDKNRPLKLHRATMTFRSRGFS